MTPQVDALKQDPQFLALPPKRQAQILLSLEGPLTPEMKALGPVTSVGFEKDMLKAPTLTTSESGEMGDFDLGEFLKESVPTAAGIAISGPGGLVARRLLGGTAGVGLEAALPFAKRAAISMGRVLGAGIGGGGGALATGQGLAGAGREAIAQAAGAGTGEALSGVVRGVTGARAAKVRKSAGLQLAEAEKRVREVMGGPASTLAEAGERMQPTLQASKTATHTRTGQALDASFAPLAGGTVDVSSLWGQLNDMPQDIPAVKQATDRLASYFVAKDTPLVPVEKLRQFSMEFGSKIRFNPTRAQAPPTPLRESAEGLIEGQFATPAEKEAYQAAKTGYKTEYADVYKRGVVKSMMDPKLSEQPSRAAEMALTTKTARLNPATARKVMTALGNDRSVVAPTLIEHGLLKDGIANFPERVAGYNPDVLKIYLGAGEAEALMRIAERVKTFRGPAGAKAEYLMGGPISLMLPPILRYSIAAHDPSALRRISVALGSLLTGDVKPFNRLVDPIRATIQAGAGVAEQVTREEKP